MVINGLFLMAKLVILGMFFLPGGEGWCGGGEETGEQNIPVVGPFYQHPSISITTKERVVRDANGKESRVSIDTTVISVTEGIPGDQLLDLLTATIKGIKNQSAGAPVEIVLASSTGMANLEINLKRRFKTTPITDIRIKRPASKLDFLLRHHNKFITVARFWVNGSIMFTALYVTQDISILKALPVAIVSGAMVAGLQQFVGEINNWFNYQGWINQNYKKDAGFVEGMGKQLVLATIFSAVIKASLHFAGVNPQFTELKGLFDILSAAGLFVGAQGAWRLVIAKYQNQGLDFDARKNSMDPKKLIKVNLSLGVLGILTVLANSFYLAGESLGAIALGTIGVTGTTTLFIQKKGTPDFLKGMTQAVETFFATSCAKLLKKNNR